jgi:hypothetical protein
MIVSIRANQTVGIQINPDTCSDKECQERIESNETEQAVGDIAYQDNLTKSEVFRLVLETI